MKPDAGVVLFEVVPAEEFDAEVSGVVDAGEVVGERGPVFHRPEL